MEGIANGIGSEMEIGKKKLREGKSMQKREGREEGEK